MRADSRTAFWGACENCGAAYVVYPGPDREGELPDTDEWEQGDLGADCYVCAGYVSWDGTDPVSAVLR